MLSVFANLNERGGETPVKLHAVLPKDLERFLGQRAPNESRWLNAVGRSA